MILPDLLRAEIARQGPLPFRDFMARALYDPEHGYYGSGRAVIGRKGDFFTSVSVGPLFGRLLARQFAEMWERLGRPTPFSIVEQGAHRGDFARDALSGVGEFSPEFAAALRYVIIEPSPRLAAEQRQQLAPFADRVQWVPNLEALAPFTGVHFSNELVDAFPVHLVKWTGAEWLERYVVAEGDELTFMDGPPSLPALAARLADLPPLPAGYVTEVNLAAPDWLRTVAARLQAGYVLAVDYGYPREEFYREERSEGTLAAYAAHRRESNPLARPGEIDLTAHVDFTTLAEAGLEAGLTLAGFTDPHHLMVGLGPLHFSEDAASTPVGQKELREFQTLMHPSLMGRAFKAICFSRGLPASAPLAGFRFAKEPLPALGISVRGALRGS